MFTSTKNKNKPGSMEPLDFLVCASVSGDKPEGRNTILGVIQKYRYYTCQISKLKHRCSVRLGFQVNGK